MAVYTQISDADVIELLSTYSLGALISVNPITAGMENSNFAVVTTQGEYVLTLFEHHALGEVREFVRLARHVASKGLSVPSPLSNHRDQWLHTLHNKPAILCSRFGGGHPQQLTPDHCRAIGAELARFHLCAEDCPNRRSDERGFDWWVAISPELSRDLTPDDRELLHAEITHQVTHRSHWVSLQHGWIHADLFHDNALFTEGAELSAILDLYNACDGAWLYDLAIVANDWCVDNDGVALDSEKVSALVDSYRSVRSISDAEWTCWNLVLRGAALRFWLSRLLAQRLASQRGELLPVDKQPIEYRNRLYWHRR